MNEFARAAHPAERASRRHRGFSPFSSVRPRRRDAVDGVAPPTIFRFAISAAAGSGSRHGGAVLAVIAPPTFHFRGALRSRRPQCRVAPGPHVLCRASVVARAMRAATSNSDPGRVHPPLRRLQPEGKGK